MQLQYVANFRYGLRDHYRCVLRELECKKDIKWQEEEQSAGCSSLRSVFTIECEEHQREKIERKLQYHGDDPGIETSSDKGAMITSLINQFSGLLTGTMERRLPGGVHQCLEDEVCQRL